MKYVSGNRRKSSLSAGSPRCETGRLVSQSGEFDLIKKLRSKCADLSPRVLKGIGDDAAAIDCPAGKTLITSDMMLEGVHFDLSYSSFHQLGYKILAVNISDIFAMGGTPEYFLLDVAVPGDCDVRSVRELYSGVMKIAKKFGISVVGGDTSSSKQGVVLAGTLLGRAGSVITRSGARRGDNIFVTGTLGDSAMGLRLLRKKWKGRMPAGSGKLVKKHLMPEPAALKRTSGVTAMIDVSDGLLIDLSHICDESKVGAIVDLGKMPVSRELARVSANIGEDPMDFALRGGEDYVLLFTSPQKTRPGAVRIGEISKKGRFLSDKGKRVPFKAEGYEHFK